MKRYLSSIGTLVILSVCHNANAAAGLFFNIISTGSSLSIKTTIPNHKYSHAGIRLNTPGASITSGCTANSHGFCLFPVSDSSSTVLNVMGASSKLKATLCLNGKGPVSCQNYTITPSSPPIPNPRFIYVGSLFTNVLTKCSINPTNGQLIIPSCASVGSGFVSPTGIAINAAGTIAYIVNSNVNSVSQCTINHTTGALAPCAIASLVSGLTNPIGITLNPAGTLLIL